MALETKCQTPGLNLRTVIGKRIVYMSATLPFRLDIDEEEAKILEKNLHNMLELILKPYFTQQQEQNSKSKGSHI
jgi:hypothetical protein